MSFTNTERTPAAHAEMRAHHDLRFTSERVLVSWLNEFGYMHAAGGSTVVAFRVARAERGGPQLSRELRSHEHRMRNRHDMRATAEWVPDRDFTRYPFRRERCSHGTHPSNHCRDCD